MEENKDNTLYIHDLETSGLGNFNSSISLSLDEFIDKEEQEKKVDIYVVDLKISTPIDLIIDVQNGRLKDKVKIDNEEEFVTIEDELPQPIKGCSFLFSQQIL